MKSVRRNILLGMMAALFLFSCAQQPIEQYGNAKAVVEELNKNGAALFFKEDVAKLNDDLTAAMSEMQAQEGKFIKNYEKAKGMLSKISEEAGAIQGMLPMIMETKTALDGVAHEGAMLYARDEFKKIYDNFGTALREIRQQSTQEVKNYDKAKELLAKVKEEGEALKPTIAAKKEESKTQTLAAQQELKNLIEEVKKFFGEATKGKKKVDVKDLLTSLTDNENSFGEVQMAVDEGNYPVAAEKVSIIKAKVMEIYEQGKQRMAQTKKPLVKKKG